MTSESSHLHSDRYTVFSFFFFFFFCIFEQSLVAIINRKSNSVRRDKKEYRENFYLIGYSSGSPSDKAEFSKILQFSL